VIKRHAHRRHPTDLGRQGELWGRHPQEFMV
jgi:hypothetical protein